MNFGNPGKRPLSPNSVLKKRPDRKDQVKIIPWKRKPEVAKNFQAFFSVPIDLDIYSYVGQELEAFDWLITPEMNLWKESNVSLIFSILGLVPLAKPDWII